jgi:ABC-type lipoprotein release transport system permease subunit
MLFGVQPVDPLTLAGATAILTATAAMACYLPMRTATRVDPVSLLRAD